MTVINTTTQLATNDHTGNGAVNLTVDAELMKNHAASRAVDAEHRIKVVQDSNGNPMIFSIGTTDVAHDNQSAFYAIIRQLGTPTGWRQIDLSSGLGNGISAVAFEVLQNSQGQLTIALAVEAATAPGVSQLYVTGPLTNNTAAIDWPNFRSQWVPRPTTNFPGLHISRILLGASDAQGDPPIMIVATTQGGGNAAHYIVDADTTRTDPAALWSLYPLPNNTDSFIDLAIGRLPRGRGVYALYQVGPTLTLEFTTFKDKFGHGPYNVSLLPPPGATVLFPLPNARGYTDLYVAGDSGLSVFPALTQQSNVSARPIADAQTIPEVRGLKELIVSTDSSETSIWALDGQENLIYTTGDNSAQPNWSYPVILRRQVAQIAPLRNQEKKTNEIFIVGGDSSLAYLWQDPVTTLWKESDIPLPDTGKLLTFNCYTTHINLVDQLGRPLMDKTVNITASEWIYVTINGASYELDPTNPISIKPDIQGNITIINKVSTISTPIFHLQADFLDHVIDVDPAARIKDGLKQIKTGSDLRNAKTRGGQPLLQGTYDDQTLNSSASAVQQLSALTTTLPQDSSPQSTNPHVFFRAASATPSNLINTTGLPEGYCWGMRLGQNRLEYLEGDAARAHFFARYQATIASDGATALAEPLATPTAAGFADALTVIGGDILEALENGVEKAAGFLIQTAGDVVEFVIDLGERVVKFALKVVAQVLSAISWILKETLGIDLDKWLQWLGLLFNWENIIVTHRVGVNLVNQYFNFVEAKIGDAEHAVSNFFEDLKGKARTLEPVPTTVASMNIQSLSSSASSGLPAGGQNSLSFLTNSPGGNYSIYHLLYGGICTFQLNGLTVSEPLFAFLNDIAIPTLASIQNTAMQLFNDLQEALNGGTLTVGQVFEKLGVDLLLGILDALETVVVGILKYSEELIALFQGIINAEIPIPFLTSLYHEFVGSKMSLLDGMVLLLAIPVTIGYELLTQKAPFGDTTYGMDTRDYNSLLRGLNLPPNPFIPTTASIAHEMLLAAADQPSAPASNQPICDGGRVYSLVGGFFSSLANVIFYIIGLLETTTILAPGEFTKVPARAANAIQGIFAFLVVAFTFPVKSGPEWGAQFVLWDFTLADLLKLFIDFTFIVDGKEKEGVPIIGGIEIGQSVINLVLISTILGIQMNDPDNKEHDTDIAQFFADLLGTLGSGFSGAAKIAWDRGAEEVAGLLALASIFGLTIGFTVDVATVIVDGTKGRAFG